MVLHGTYDPPPANYEIHEDDTIVTLSQFAEREGLHRDSLRMTMLQHINRGRHTPCPRFGISLYFSTLSRLHYTPPLVRPSDLDDPPRPPHARTAPNADALGATITIYVYPSLRTGGGAGSS